MPRPTLEGGSSAAAKPVVIGVVGGPGAGKGTQCELICQRFKVSHISIGDVLRAEMANDESSHGQVIKKNMLAGTFAPKEVTMAVVQSHMNRAAEGGIKVFVLDGFPRHVEQLHHFESLVAPLKTLILLKCSEQTMIDRLLSRGRFDDIAESISGRLRTFNEVTSDVVGLMQERGTLDIFDAEQPIEAVGEGIVKLFSNFAEERELAPDFLGRGYPVQD